MVPPIMWKSRAAASGRLGAAGGGGLRGGGWAPSAVKRYQGGPWGNTELGSEPDPVATEEGM